MVWVPGFRTFGLRPHPSRRGGPCISRKPLHGLDFCIPGTRARSYATLPGRGAPRHPVSGRHPIRMGPAAGAAMRRTRVARLGGDGSEIRRGASAGLPHEESDPRR